MIMQYVVPSTLHRQPVVKEEYSDQDDSGDEDDSDELSPAYKKNKGSR